MSSPDRGLRRALEESRDRIQSLALVHDQLYRAANPASIELEHYLLELVRSIERTVGRGDQVRLVVAAVACSIPLDVAVPCGLIVNELVTNALKHAFPSGRQGTITVSVGPVSDHELVVAVRDDGVGLPADFGLGQGSGLGMVIVETLVHQLGATLTIERAGGTGFELRIPRLPHP
jgi:two-component sensor histidine kinase